MEELTKQKNGFKLQGKIESVEVKKIICITVVEGAGTSDDPCRESEAYFTPPHLFALAGKF